MNGQLARPAPLLSEPRRPWIVGGGLVALGAVVVSAAVLAVPGSMTMLVAAPLALIAAVAAVYLGLRHPLVALCYFLVALFLRLALPSVLPVDAFLPAFGGLVMSAVIWLCRNPDRIPKVGAVEAAMLAYVLWNIVSVLTPHRFPAAAYLPAIEPLDLTRVILTSAVMPFTLYYIGRTLRDRTTRAVTVAWVVVAFGAFSAAVSILQFHAPALVWPRYIVTSPNWVGRANGVPNQPVVNGIILVVGFTVAMYLASRRTEPPWRRIIATVVVVASAYAVFLTHTRAIYLAFVLVLLLGAVFARGFRRGFTVTAALGAVIVIANWSTFTSSDRSKGGVGSSDEVFDRLNTAATSLWAFDREPLFGWGLGRFVSVNTIHHQQWSPDIPFERGLGIASHFNELGILADLGLVGLTLWLAVLVLMATRLVRAYRRPRADDPELSQALTVCAALGLVVMVTAGSSVDLRLFDFPTVLVMMFVGIAIGQAEAVTELARDAASGPTIRREKSLQP